MRPPDPDVIDAPAATTEWPEEPRPIGELESGDGAGISEARATSASPLASTRSGVEPLLPLGARARETAAAAAAAAAGDDELGEKERACAAAARGAADAFRQTDDDDTAAEQRPEVDAALCEVALIERALRDRVVAGKRGQIKRALSSQGKRNEARARAVCLGRRRSK